MDNSVPSLAKLFELAELDLTTWLRIKLRHPIISELHLEYMTEADDSYHIVIKSVSDIIHITVYRNDKHKITLSRHWRVLRDEIEKWILAKRKEN